MRGLAIMRLLIPACYPELKSLVKKQILLHTSVRSSCYTIYSIHILYMGTPIYLGFSALALVVHFSAEFISTNQANLGLGDH